MGIIKKSCEKCKRNQRRSWIYKGKFFCYTCYRTELRKKREKGKKQIKKEK